MLIERKCSVCDKRGCTVCREQENPRELLFQRYMPHAKRLPRAANEWNILNRLNKTRHILSFLETLRSPGFKYSGPEFNTD